MAECKDTIGSITKLVLIPRNEVRKMKKKEQQERLAHEIYLELCEISGLGIDPIQKSDEYNFVWQAHKPYERGDTVRSKIIVDVRDPIPDIPQIKDLQNDVNHPIHYGGDTQYEAIKVINAWNLGFETGNAVKYIARAGKKDPSKYIQDLEKAVWYLQHKIKMLKDGTDE